MEMLGGPENIKKFREKKLVKLNKSKIFFREIKFLAVLNFFPTSKIDFWSFLKLQKIEFGQKQIRVIDLFDFMSFVGIIFPTFLQFFQQCPNFHLINENKTKETFCLL